MKRRGISSSEMCDIVSMISGSVRNSGPLRVMTMLFFETCATVYIVTQSHILEERNSNSQRCDSIRMHTSDCLNTRAEKGKREIWKSKGINSLKIIYSAV